jgi:hypothetical protein
MHYEAKITASLDILHSTRTFYTQQEHSTFNKNILHLTRTFYNQQGQFAFNKDILHSTRTIYIQQGHSTLNKDILHSTRTIYIQQGHSTVQYNSQFYFSNNNHHKISQTIISYKTTLNYSSTTNYNYRYLLPVTLSVVVVLFPVPTLLEAKHV